EDSLVEERGPTLVHDLGLDLRDEVLRLFVDDGEEILLPLVQEWVVVADEEEDVLVGRRRYLAKVRLDELLPAMDALEGIGARGGGGGTTVALLTLRETIISTLQTTLWLEGMH